MTRAKDTPARQARRARYLAARAVFVAAGAANQIPDAAGVRRHTVTQWDLASGDYVPSALALRLLELAAKELSKEPKA